MISYTMAAARLRSVDTGGSRLISKQRAVQCGKALPEHLVAARKRKRIGLLASAGLAVTGLAAGITFEVSHIRWATASFLAICGLGTAASTGFGGLLRTELHNGRLYIQWGESPPESGPPAAQGAIEVRATGDSRGNGAFALQNIAEGTFLGPYEGELLDEAQYWSRYPTGMSDYAICIDQEWTLDARDRVNDTSSFSPCHINHSGTRNNVIRKPLRQERAIHFFAKRDIEAGEELLLDYGRMYWRGREDAEID